jgi:hypothetical protein
MRKFHSLNASRLTIVNLAGLSNETIIAGNAAGSVALGTLGMAAFDALVTANSAFRGKLIMDKGSTLTKQIHDLDRQRDADFQEIWRTAGAAAKSSITANAEAGQTLVKFLKSYHDSPKEPLMSETSTFQYMHIRFNENPNLQNAAVTLQLDGVFANLFTASEQISDVWNERANEDA